MAKGKRQSTTIKALIADLEAEQRRLLEQVDILSLAIKALKS